MQNCVHVFCDQKFRLFITFNIKREREREREREIWWWWWCVYTREWVFITKINNSRLSR